MANLKAKEAYNKQLEYLKQILTKEIIEEYLFTHSYKDTLLYFRSAYNCSQGMFKELYDFFSIEKRKGINLRHENREELKKSFIAKFGVDNPQKSKKVQEKTKQTNLEKYGVENAAQNEQVKQKQKQTTLKRYGCENVFQAKNVKEKIKATSLERYGTEYCAQSEQTKAKTRQTKLERYGDAGYHNFEKTKQTNLEKYGSENIFNNPEKARQTCREKYGVNNVAQLRDVHIKMANTRSKSIAKDGTKFDSGWEVLVYEYALSKGYTIERQSPINYNNKQITFIDFKINGKLYEVKGPHLLNNIWLDAGASIEDKLACYKDNNINIITDISKINYRDPAINYIDIHSLNF